jgi:hypothetical protein
MANLRRSYLAMFLAAAFVTAFAPLRAHSQSLPSTLAPKQFEFFEGHAYTGSESVKWQHDKLVFLKRVASMKGDGLFNETVEQLTPTPEAWQHFLARVDSLGIWQWKSDYSDPKRSMPDGDSWALTLNYGAKQLRSRGYNAVPANYSELRAAVYKLLEDARHPARE